MNGSGPGELSYPRGIHVDHDYVYVVEWGNHRVSVFHTSGAFISSFGKGGREGELNSPKGITTDQDGFLYVCDTSNNRIQMFEQYIFVHSRTHAMDHASRKVALPGKS